MLITNKYDLPETIVRALRRKQEEYNAGNVDSSVTSLISPARIALLRKVHYSDISVDLSEQIFALLGTGIHHLLEVGKTPGMITEERLFMTIDGWRISGAIDVQEVRDNEIDITDYKVTSVYSVTASEEPKDDWVSQLNLHALLIEANKPMRVRSLTICAFLRDWSGEKARNDPLYPQAPIVQVPIPLWSKKKQLAYVRERVTAHRQARFDHKTGEPLEECTPGDRWVRNSKWEVIKKGAKRATRVFSNEGEAAILAEQKGADYEVIHREGKSTRCRYCGVSQFCDQFQRMTSKDNDDESYSSSPETED